MYQERTGRARGSDDSLGAQLHAARRREAELLHQIHEKQKEFGPGQALAETRALPWGQTGGRLNELCCLNEPFS